MEHLYGNMSESALGDGYSTTLVRELFGTKWKIWQNLRHHIRIWEPWFISEAKNGELETI